jgi:hypothetical protein
MHIEVHLRRCLELDQPTPIAAPLSSSGATNEAFVPTYVVPVEPQVDEKSASHSSDGED